MRDKDILLAMILLKVTVDILNIKLNYQKKLKIHFNHWISFLNQIILNLKTWKRCSIIKANLDKLKYKSL